jgi:hypothetical protein
MSSFTGRLAVNTNGSFTDATDAARGLLTATDHQALTAHTNKLNAATAAATPNVLAQRDANGDLSVRQLHGKADTAGAADSAATATLAATATTANALGGQAPAYYAPAGVAIANAVHATNADNATNATNASQLGGQAPGYYQPAGTPIANATNATNAVNATNATQLAAGGADRAKLDRLGTIRETYLAADVVVGTSFNSQLSVGPLPTGVWQVTAHAVLGCAAATQCRITGLLQTGGGTNVAEDQQVTPGGGALGGLHAVALVNGGSSMIFFVRGNTSDTVLKATNNESPQVPGRASYIKAICVG